MKRILLISAVLLQSAAFCQTEKTPKRKPNFNRWSIDAGVGLNNPILNFTPGYNTSLFNIGKAEVGVRYMFNSYFGLRADLTFNRFQDSPDSPHFATNHGRFAIDGVLSISNAFRFYEWTDRFGLLAHAGVGVGRTKPEGFPLFIAPVNKSGSERIGIVSFGVTPQFKISPKLSLHLDVAMVLQAKTHYTFDWMSTAELGGFNSRFFEGSIGMSYYLGKKEEHADWSPSKSVSKSDIDDLAAENEKMRLGMMDDDKDGVPNYLDLELDTPANAPVNMKGVTDKSKMDSDFDGIADSFDDCPNVKGLFSTNGCPDSDKDGVADKDDKCPDVPGYAADMGCKSAVSGNNGEIQYVTSIHPMIYFTTSSYSLSSVSKGKLITAAKALKADPAQNVVLTGHTDGKGDEDFNKNLSINRANEAKRYLIQQGIASSRITTKFESSDKPTKTNATSDGRAKNRRVEVKIQ